MVYVIFREYSELSGTVSILSGPLPGGSTAGAPSEQMRVAAPSVAGPAADTEVTLRVVAGEVFNVDRGDPPAAWTRFDEESALFRMTGEESSK